MGCTCHVVRGFPTFALCLEHICAGGGGGVVLQIWVLYHYIGGDYRLTSYNCFTCINVMS